MYNIFIYKEFIYICSLLYCFYLYDQLFFNKKIWQGILSCVLLKQEGDHFTYINIEQNLS